MVCAWWVNNACATTTWNINALLLSKGHTLVPFVTGMLRCIFPFIRCSHTAYHTLYSYIFLFTLITIQDFFIFHNVFHCCSQLHKTDTSDIQHYTTLHHTSCCSYYPHHRCYHHNHHCHCYHHHHYIPYMNFTTHSWHLKQPNYSWAEYLFKNCTFVRYITNYNSHCFQTTSG